MEGLSGGVLGRGTNNKLRLDLKHSRRYQDTLLMQIFIQASDNPPVYHL